MRMLNGSELEVVSGGLIPNPDGTTNSSGPLANGPLAKYIYQLTGGSASGADNVGVNESKTGASLDEVVVTAPREVVNMSYEACVAVFGLAGYHLADKYGQKIAAQIMSRALAAAGFVVAGPVGAVVGGAVGYAAGHEWGEEHGSTYGAVGAGLIGTAVCPR